MEQPSSIPVRTSGIPRPTSRLPVLRSSGSQSQLRSVASTEQLRKKPSISSISRPSQPQPSLQKKASRTSLVRSNTPSTASTATARSSRASVTSNTKRAIPGSTRTSTSDAAVFKKPLGRPPSRQSRTTPQITPTSDTSHGEDVLGDLDAFRSASRASSRADSRADFRENDAEFVPEGEVEVAKPAPRKARPSLSERTIESLSQLPSSPAVSKSSRRSSFFNADNSMPPPLRPASALGNGRRPMTSDGTPQAAPTTPRRLGAPAQRGSMTAPGKRSISAAMTTPSGTPSKAPSGLRPISTLKKQPLSQVQNVHNTPKPRPLSNSKTMVTRTPTSRASIAGVFGQAISPPGKALPATPSPNKPPVANKTPDTTLKVSSSSTALREQIAKAKAARRSDVAPKADATPPKTNSSSQALREQIAKAKEAARRAQAPRETRTDTPPREAIVPDPAEMAEFDFGLGDPFNQRSKGSKSLLRKRVDAGRVDGRLNLAAMGLNEIPEDVLNMYKYDANDTTIAWGEVVDVTTIIAADNELQSLPEAMFPDVDPESVIDDDDSGPQFGGVQNLDLHGNVLQELPMGLQRLTQLSKLNLSRNKLRLNVWEVISRIASLRELKLAENALEGEFPSSLGNLELLEVLELQSNKLTSLPPEVRGLAHLRTLNISNNQFRALPTEIFTSVPIIELIATKNAFSGSFFDVDTVPHLQNLQLSNNSLTSFCESGTILLPALKYLDISNNRLSSLPDISSWTSLTTLLVGENKLEALPEGFVSLQQLRNADFTANNITKLDEKLALMEGLDILTLAANPLQIRKFLTMNTEDIKRDLLSRLAPSDAEVSLPGTADVNEEICGANSGWKLTPSGTLDLSFQNITEVDEEAIVTFAKANDIRQLYLQQNYLTIIPGITAQLSVLTVLDLSKNNIFGPLEGPLHLPKLRELRLSGNKMQSLEPLTSFLSAPNLQHLDVSNNRLSGFLPNLRDVFPELMLLMASDNNISEVPAESLNGLKIVNLSNNDIGRLEPEIGLHIGTLTSLDVEGNKFRVPNYAILRKGTDAILNWLRDKIPSPTEEFFDASTF